MIYEVRTLGIGSKLYKACGYPYINMQEIIKHQIANPPKDEKEKRWAYSLYCSQNPNACAGYIPDYRTPYLIEITLKKNIEYIFTDDPAFYVSENLDQSYMEKIVIHNTSQAIYNHTNDKDRSTLHYPTMSFMKELGEKGFAFSDIMVYEIEEDGETNIQHEFIIPHSLLIGDVFSQRQIDYKMNDKMDKFESITI